MQSKLAKDLGLDWVVGRDYPEWADTPAYLRTISNGYLLKGETPQEGYRRVANSVAQYLQLGNAEFFAGIEDKFYDYIQKGWLCLSSPVLFNSGTTRGLPISCYSIAVGDSIYSIGNKVQEMMLLAKHGGGVGVDMNNIRPAGSPITDNGNSQGVVPFCKVFDSAIHATSQGSTRRGSSVLHLNIEHEDFEEWLEIIEPKGDLNRQCLNIFLSAVVSDEFMRKVEDGDEVARRKWSKLLYKRRTRGMPYIVFIDAINRDNPIGYVNNNLKVSISNLCSEITLYTDVEHSFVCCLSSLNLAKYEEWEDTDLVQTSIYFLNGVMDEFLDKASNIPGFECAVRGAKKGRALGLGVLGWATMLQKRGLPFSSVEANKLTVNIFSNIKHKAYMASHSMLDILNVDEPEWCQGSGMYNSHLLSTAPTVSNSKLSGDVSPGIEPWAANLFDEESAKGDIIRRNKELELVLTKLNLNTEEVWEKIMNANGSIQGINELDGWFINGNLEDVDSLNQDGLGYSVKEVFKTFVEINQLSIVQQQAIRQQYIDQSVSLNLKFPEDAPPKFINQVHMEAWRMGLKTLYYQRGQNVLKADSSLYAPPTCLACDG
jgi:ribonucleoside-diphosphate reductase alpha chain